MKLTVTFDTDDEIAAFVAWKFPVPQPSQNLRESSSLREWQASELGKYQWTVRTENLLRAAGFLSFDEISRYPETALLKLPNFGRKSLEEVKAALNEWCRRPQQGPIR